MLCWLKGLVKNLVRTALVKVGDDLLEPLIIVVRKGCNVGVEFTIELFFILVEQAAKGAERVDLEAAIDDDIKALNRDGLFEVALLERHL